MIELNNLHYVMMPLQQSAVLGQQRLFEEMIQGQLEGHN